jgi:pimeloyl-ACP methyl ester carboxylesterase
VERAVLDGVTLEYEVVGQGEPVLFIHGSFLADMFRPLVQELSLFSGFRLITYHRRGYGGSSHADRVLSIAEQSADCAGLLEHLDVTRAHVVGHSFGGVVALQLALGAPELVRTLALLEPALAVGDSGVTYRESLSAAIQRFRDQGAPVVVDAFLEARWPGYRAPLERALPGALERAVEDAPHTFESELPGLLDWRFGQDQARRINQPVLSMLGGGSEALSPRFGETHRALCAWLPQAEAFVLPNATHLFHIENPRDTTAALAAFLSRHPMAD